MLKTSTFKSAQLESITLLLNINRYSGNFTKQNHLYVTSKPAQGPLSYECKSHLEQDQREKQDCFAMICCKVHYTICLIMNPSHIVRYLRLHQQEGYTAKNTILAHWNKGGKGKKSTHDYLISCK